MKKTILFLLTFLLLISLFPANTSVYAAVNSWDGSVASNFAGGNGTQNNPYLIKTGAQLAFLAESVNSDDSMFVFQNEYFSLESDIDLNKNEWIPIGGDSHYFSGIFLGNGHTISNLYINQSSSQYVGLFGNIFGGSVKKLHLQDVAVRGSERVGGLVGDVAGDGVITKCSVNGIVRGSSMTGGLAGYAGSNITDCSSKVAVTGGTYTGGIVGFQGSNGTISRCVNDGTVNGSGQMTGGIVGTNNSIVEDCFNAGMVSGTTFVGGICGSADSISNCGNIGTVSGSRQVGGVWGNAVQGSVTGCYNAGLVSGSAAGALGGYATSSIIRNNYYQSDSNSNILGEYPSSSYPNTMSEIYSVSNCATQEFTDTLNANVDVFGTQWTRSTTTYQGYPYIELRTVTGITVTTQPTTKTYYSGMSFNPAGMVVMANFDDGSTGAIEGYTVTPSGGLSKGTTSVTLQYNGFTAKVKISVEDLPFSGSGTSSDPYIIKTEKDLRTMSEMCYYSENCDSFLSAYYKQACNITVKESGWLPIGADPDHVFSGEYKGYGYSISGISDSSEMIVKALFGSVSGKISMLTLKNVSFSNAMMIGGIAGEVTGEILGCQIDSITISGAPTFAGGIAGSVVGGGLSGCIVNGGEITGKYAGGIASSVKDKGVITKCENYAKVTSSDTFAGGLAGSLDSSIISESANYGDVSATKLAGGAAASIIDSVIKGVNNYGAVEATASDGIAGGMTASVMGGVLEECNNFGAITANKYSGGIAGYASSNSDNGTDLKINTCLNAGFISARYDSSSIGGGVAGTQNNCTIINCLNNGSVVSTGDAGGISGECMSGSVLFNCANTKDVTTFSYSGYAGGIIGYAGSVAAEACYNTGHLYGSSSYLGAIAGYFSSSGSTLTGCYYSDTSSSNGVGGGYGAVTTAITEESMKSDSFCTTMNGASTWSDCNNWVRNSITNETLPVPGEWFLQEMKGIIVSTLPINCKYHIDEAFDPEGMIVKGVLTNGAKVDVPQDYSFSVEPFTTSGKKLVTVYQDGFETSFDVIVYGLSLPVIDGSVVTAGFAYDSAPADAEAVYILAAYDIDGRYLGSDIEVVSIDTEYHELKFEADKQIDRATLFTMDNNYAPVHESFEEWQ